MSDAQNLRICYNDRLKSYVLSWLPYWYFIQGFETLEEAQAYQVRLTFMLSSQILESGSSWDFYWGLQKAQEELSRIDANV